jgi:hypothetical protein
MRPIFINRINKCSYAYLDAAPGTVAAAHCHRRGETGKLHLKSRQVQVDGAAVFIPLVAPFWPSAADVSDRYRTGVGGKKNQVVAS